MFDPCAALTLGSLNGKHPFFLRKNHITFRVAEKGDLCSQKEKEKEKGDLSRGAEIPERKKQHDHIITNTFFSHGTNDLLYHY